MPGLSPIKNDPQTFLKYLMDPQTLRNAALIQFSPIKELRL